VFRRKAKEEDRFISLLIQQASEIVEGLRLLETLLDHPDRAALEQLSVLEHKADETRRILIDELHNTFITPIDREDLFQLSLYMDDMLDYGYTTLEEMVMLRVPPDNYIRKMIALIREEAEELHMAAQRLSGNPRLAGDHAHKAKHIENKVDHLYRKAVAELFTHAADPAQMPALLAKREVYRHASNMSDKADNAANVFGMVVMKLS
jgi:uncharacterized protein Yka (UPF0111/DUF47 family)